MWGGDAVFTATIDGRLTSLNAQMGDKNWDINTIDKSAPYTITGAPRIVKGKVIIGNGGAELGVRGYITAYDAITGKQEWRFIPCRETQLMVSKMKPWKWRQKLGPVSIGLQVAVALLGIQWFTIPNWTYYI
jgi:glucose dehydrogenase